MGTGKYDDIIDLPHHRSTKHEHMSISDRAAQFAPFAALTGHNEAVKETARITEKRPELSEDEKDRIGETLIRIRRMLSEHPEVSITYFREDERKEGGACIEVTGTIEKLDEAARRIRMRSGEVIGIDDIVQLESDDLEDAFEYISGR